jgi:hypothetical protein
VIHNAQIWFLRPAGPVEFGPSEEYELGGRHTPKRMNVEILGGHPRRLVDVPEVLATLPSNQYLARGTFRPIDDWGCFKAIDVAAGLPTEGAHWEIGDQNCDQLIECIGSSAMETLVAKILEANGCFVPAHRGGTVKDIDLIAHNDFQSEIRIGEMVIPARSAVSVQVKRWASGIRKPDAADFLVGIDATGPGSLGSSWILRETVKMPEVRRWFLRSISWLPDWFLESPRIKILLSECAKDKAAGR